MRIQKVAVAGGGTLGSQIAFQAAYKGFPVSIWLRSEASIGRAEPKLEHLVKVYKKTLEAMKTNPSAYCRGLADSADVSVQKLDTLIQQADIALSRIALQTSEEEVFGSFAPDLVIEAIAEVLSEKEAFYRKVCPLLPAKTIIATNSSTLIPSDMAGCVDRPDRFLAMHFANEIWRNNTAEIMGSEKTDAETFRDAVSFARSIGMIPLELKKEQRGYLLNSMLVPFLDAAQALLANGVADPQTIDMAWKLGTGAPLGPFQILDIVGLKTAYNIVMEDPQAKDAHTTAGKIAAILREHIEAGHTGVNTGEGFYKY